MEFYVIPDPSLSKRKYDIADLEFNILTRKPELYEFIDIYTEPLRNVSTLLFTPDRKRGDIAANYTESIIEQGRDENITVNTSYYQPVVVSTPIYETIDISNVGGGNTIRNLTGYEDVTWYYVYRNITQTVREELVEWNLDSPTKLIIEITVPYPSNDIFDIEVCFVGVCTTLPAPSFNTSTQADWDLGIYNNTLANSTGLLTLHHGYNSFIENAEGINLTGLLISQHFENGTGSNDTHFANSIGPLHNGTCTGSACPNYSVDGRIVGELGLFYDGSDDIIEFGSDSSIDNLDTKDGLTIVWWSNWQNARVGGDKIYTKGTPS